MIYCFGILLLVHVATPLPTGKQAWNEDVADAEEPAVEVVATEIAPRVQDPTEHLVCRLVSTGVVLVPGLRQYLFSPGALCVSPEKPKPFPLLFSPPAPLAAESLKPPDSKGPVPRPAPAVAPAPAPTISLLFSSPVGSIGIGGPSSPAVNIQSQSIADPATWLVRGVVLPIT